MPVTVSVPVLVTASVRCQPIVGAVVDPLEPLEQKARQPTARLKGGEDYYGRWERREVECHIWR